MFKISLFTKPNILLKIEFLELNMSDTVTKSLKDGNTPCTYLLIILMCTIFTLAQTINKSTPHFNSSFIIYICITAGTIYRILIFTDII